MTTEFFKAITREDILTENGMPTNSTSGMSLVDMFFKMGGSRTLKESQIIEMFVKAFGESSLHALKLMFYNRDIRGGQGERRSFRVMWRYLSCVHPEFARKNIENVPFYGRWDDLLVSLDSPIEGDVADFILFSLKHGDKLCAKWMPRENKAGKEIALKLMKLWGMSPRNYRKLLAGNTKVVETLMCNKQWNLIKYEQVPSVAMKKYRKAWYRNDQERYETYLESLKKGETTIHASAIFPHDLVAPMLNYWGQRNIANNAELTQLEEQWKRLPDYVGDLDFIPICDVSGSMFGEPMSVCVSLGLYLSERNKSKFKNHVITFSERPQLVLLKGVSLFDRVQELAHVNWGGNTNLEAVFELILNQAVKWNLPKEEMPNYILIMSDMQFDYCIKNPSFTAFRMISDAYEKAGYRLPQIIFWNLRTSFGVPVSFDQRGTALISGFSPSIMTAILGGEMNPLSIMFNMINKERYNKVVI